MLIGDEYEARLAAQPKSWIDPPSIDEHDVAEIFYTSGSTGLPKGAMLTHRGLYLHAIHSALTLNISGNDVVLHTIPLFHVNGWGTPHYITGLGGVHVMLPRFDSTEVLRLVEAERVTRLYLVPAMLTLLLNDPTFDTRDLTSVQQLSVGGAPTPPALLAEAERRFGCECICGYGMTESSPQMTKAIDKPGEPRSARRRSTTGMPILGVDLRIFDDQDNELPWDGVTPGEIRARSNHVMKGYWERPEETAAALAGGWLHTGDVATMSPDGFLTIVDRKKDLIISGGENISSVEVENALRGASRGARGRGRRRARRTLGRGAPRVRRAPRGSDSVARRAHRVRARTARPLQGAEGGARPGRAPPWRHRQGLEERPARREAQPDCGTPIIQRMPNLSVHMPHFGEKKVSMSGWTSSPPSASAA